MSDKKSDTEAIEFVWSDRCLAFFTAHNIFLDYPWNVSGHMRAGEPFKVRRSVKVEPFSNMPRKQFISSGAFSYCRSGSIPSDFAIGRYCSIAPGVRVGDQEHPLDRISTHAFTMHKHTERMAMAHFGRAPKPTPFQMSGPPPQIGHDVWIGRDALVKRGVKLGTGCVVAERCVVTRDVPPFAIVAGVPGRIIRYRFDEQTISRVLESQWWDYNFSDFTDLPLNDPNEFSLSLQSKAREGKIRPFLPRAICVADELHSYLETGKLDLNAI